MIYLDHHAATNPCQSAIERMMPYLTENWAAPYSPHKMGQTVITDVLNRKMMIYDLVGAHEEDQFVFTSSGAEAINQVFWSIFLEKARKEGKCHIIVSSIEDIPTMQCAKRLEELGCFIKIVPVNDQGQIDLAALKQMMSPKIALISLTMAHGLTGVIQPYEQVIEMAKNANVLPKALAYVRCFFLSCLVCPCGWAGILFCKLLVCVSPCVACKYV